MVIKGVADAKKFTADLRQKRMQTLIFYTFDRAIFDVTLQPAYIERQFPEVINVTFIF